jgi:TPR repeat protein
MTLRQKFAYATGAAAIAGIVVFSSPVNGAGLDDARAAMAKQDFPAAAAKFQEAVEQGDPEAMALMGTMYFYGIGVPYDREKSFALNLKATALGRVDAQYLLVFGYNAKAVKNPDKPLRDEEYAEQIKWQKAAAEGAAPKAEVGDPIAQWVWAHLIKDQSKSVFWLRKAADQNVVVAQFDLGRVYDLGNDVNAKPDPLKAREWYTKAAQAGHAGAAFYLAKILETSGGKEEAKLLYAKAALAGDPIASAMLRDHYNIPLGDPKEFDQLQANLLAKNAVHQLNAMINYGGVALGNAVTSLVGPGDTSVDPAALSKYRANLNSYTNDMVDSMRAEQLQRSQADAVRQNNEFRQSGRLMDEERCGS